MGKSAICFWQFIHNDSVIDYVQHHPESGIVQTETPCLDASCAEIFK